MGRRAPIPKQLDPLWLPPSLIPNVGGLRKTDAEGRVWVGFVLEEFEQFIAMLNESGVVTHQAIEEHEELPGIAVLCNFRPTYQGDGIAAIEVLTTVLDRCQDGRACSKHPWLPPGHTMNIAPLQGGAQQPVCKAPAEPCSALRHGPQVLEEAPVG